MFEGVLGQLWESKYAMHFRKGLPFTVTLSKRVWLASYALVRQTC